MGLRGWDNFKVPEGTKVLTMDGPAARAPLPGQSSFLDPPAAEAVAKPARNKYGAVRTEYAGLKYDSKAEAEYAALLDREAELFPGTWWIRQPVFRLGCPENVYRADFLVFCPHRFGSLNPAFVVDVKGVRTAKFERDVKLWRAYGPCNLCIAGRAGRLWKTEIVPGKS